MRTDQAKRLTKLAAKRIGNAVMVEHKVWCHYGEIFKDGMEQSNEYSVAYFVPDSNPYSMCKNLNFSTWQAAEAFLKQLALEGLPDVQELDANAL